MLVLSRADVEALLTMPDAIEAVDAGFRQLAVGNVVMPQRVATPVRRHDGLHLSMPAFVDSDADGNPGTLSIKIVTVYGENAARFGLPMIQGVILLHDAANGQLLAMLDAEHLTAVRTGAASGVATRALARGDAANVVIFGAGAQAGAQLAAVCAVRPIRRATVLTRTGKRDSNFCRRMEAELGVEVRSSRDVQAAIEGADIVCTATNAATSLFNGEWLQPGAHINAIGAYTATMRELDATTVARSRIFVDHHRAAQTEAGDILLAIADGAIIYDHVVGELGNVLTGKLAGRTSDDEITVFKSVGLAMQDAVTVAQVYAQARARGVGQEVTL